MAKIRTGIGSDFRLKDQKLGLGENNPQERLDVAGVAKGKDLKVTGISSLTAYEGFLRADQQIAENTTLNFDQGPVSSLSGEIIVGTGQTVTVTGVGLGTTMVGNGSGTIENTIDTTDATRAGGSEIECLKVYDTFTPPSGGTNERPYAPKPGELYYNYDFKTIEFFDGYGWRQVDNTTRSGRGLFGGGTNAAAPNGAKGIEYIQIHTRGNSQIFGELTVAAGFCAALSSSTRGIWGSRYTGSGNNTIDYVTIPSQGNAIDFGNSTGSLWSRGGLSSSTRGIFFGGQPSSNVIEYIEMDTLGNALDFGDLMSSRRDPSGFASATRGIMAGGNPGIGADYTVIESITIASKGNSTRFGEKDGLGMMSGSANATRGIFAGGSTVPTLGGFSNIDFITIASEGNAVNFGDLTLSTYRSCAMASQTRAVFAHGTYTPGSNARTSMDYITIASQGDAIDFGDKSETREYADGGCSDSHGGLGGF